MALPESSLSTPISGQPGHVQMRDVETGPCGGYLAQYTKDWGGGPLMNEHEAICEMQWVDEYVLTFRLVLKGQ